MGRRLTPVERDIWTKFSAQEPLPKTIFFEVPIQKLTPVGAKYEINQEINWWDRITALRIDVLWSIDLGYCIAEIEETLTMESIGQALCYRELWNELNPGAPIKKALVISAGHDERLVPGLKAAGLDHYLVNTLP